MYAEYGVTTAYSLGSGPTDAQEGLTLRDQQEQGPLDRARLYSAGLVIADKTPDEARKNVDRHVDQKVDIIKIRVDGEDGNPNKMTPDVYRAVIDQAHKRGMRVAAHMFYLKDAQGLVDAGADVLAHSIRDQDVPPAFIAELKKRNIGYIPTLTRDLSVFVYESTPAFFSEPFFLRGQSLYGKQVAQLKDPAAQEKVRNNKDAQSIKKALEQANRNLKLLSDGGVPIAMGTDSGANLVGRWQGYFEHIEMEMMAKAGMTPAQTIAAATGGAARVMHLDSKLGTLQPGKWADFVVLDANPLTDIKNLRQIAAVWIAGQRMAKMAPATAAIAQLGPPQPRLGACGAMRRVTGACASAAELRRRPHGRPRGAPCGRLRQGSTGRISVDERRWGPRSDRRVGPDVTSTLFASPACPHHTNARTVFFSRR